MARGSNPFFDKSYFAEQNLIEDMTVEAIQVAGFDVYYVPREIVREDELFNEISMSEFTEEYAIEAYIESVDGFGGEGDFLSQFGLEIRESAIFVMAKRRFKQEIPLTRPREGDLIYFPLSRSLLEITNVDHENPFYQAGKNYVYRLTCELFRYGDETITTGLEEIDSVDTELSNEGNLDNELFGDNDTIEQEANNNIDFSEDDPFGGF